MKSTFCTSWIEMKAIENTSKCIWDWSNDECAGCRMSCAACAVCAVDAARLGAYANSYHGNSWDIMGRRMGADLILSIKEGF